MSHRDFVGVCVRAACVLLCVLTAHTAAAQTEHRFELGVQFVGVASGEFDSTDTGVSVAGGWRPFAALGAEAEFGFYQGDFPDVGAFSSSRVEGLFGVTVGPVIGSVRPFVKARGGFLAFREASEPFACILIFPPPLQCVLAGGKTVPALDLGGGVEFFPTRRTFVRVDVSDRALRYPGTVFDRDGEIRDAPYFGHDFRFGIGGGVRF